MCITYSKVNFAHSLQVDTQHIPKSLYCLLWVECLCAEFVEHTEPNSTLTRVWPRGAPVVWCSWHFPSFLQSIDIQLVHVQRIKVKHHLIAYDFQWAQIWLSWLPLNFLLKKPLNLEKTIYLNKQAYDYGWLWYWWRVCEYLGAIPTSRSVVRARGRAIL